MLQAPLLSATDAPGTPEAPDSAPTPATPRAPRWRALLEEALTDVHSARYLFIQRVLILLVMLSIALIAAEGVEDWRVNHGGLLSGLDNVVLVAFTLEYVANIVVSRPKYRYVIGVWGLIDLLAILPFYLGFLDIPGLLILRELRIVRVVRVLKLMKAASASREDADEVWLPLAIFVSLAGTAWIVDDFMSRLGIGDLHQIRGIVSYSAQVAVALSGAYFVNRLLQVFIWDGLMPRKFGIPVPRLIRDVAALLVYTLATCLVIGVVFRMPLSGIWTATGALSVVIGLALRNVILDLFMGLATQIDRPFKIGDFVMLQPGNVMGQVEEVHWRTTRIHTNENNTVIVPNSRIGEMLVTNFSFPNARSEFELLFTLDYSVPNAQALDALTAGAMAVAGQGGILNDPQPKARVKGTSPLGVEYKVKYWIDCTQVGPGKARHTVLTSVFDHLRAAGLTLAHPKQEVWYAPLAAPPAGMLPAPALADDEDENQMHGHVTHAPHAAHSAEAAQGTRGVLDALAGLDVQELTALAQQAATRRPGDDTPVAELLARRPELIDLLSHVLAEAEVADGSDMAALSPAARVLRRAERSAQFRAQLAAQFGAGTERADRLAPTLS